MPTYQGKEVTVKPLPEDDPRHAGNPNELMIVTDGDGNEKIVDKGELEAEAKAAKDKEAAAKKEADAKAKAK